MLAPILAHIRAALRPRVRAVPAAVDLVVHVLDELFAAGRASCPLVGKLVLTLTMLAAPSPHSRPVLFGVRESPPLVLVAFTLPCPLQELGGRWPCPPRAMASATDNRLWIARLITTCGAHRVLLATKRAHRSAAYMPAHSSTTFAPQLGQWPPSNRYPSKTTPHELHSWQPSPY